MPLIGQTFHPYSIQKANKIAKRFIQKAVVLLFAKCLAFLYKKHDTLRYVTFLYTKSQTLCKNQDNFRYVCVYKKQDTLRYVIFHEIFEVGIYIQKE